METQTEQSFAEMMDDLDANIKRIKAEIAGAENDDEDE